MVRIGVARVHGRSMLPTLRAGDRLLVRYGVPARLGSVVVARFPDGTLVVKRAAARDGTGWWLERDNREEGVDSATVGSIADRDVVGVALARLWPHPGILRPMLPPP